MQIDSIIAAALCGGRMKFRPSQRYQGTGDTKVPGSCCIGISSYGACIHLPTCCGMLLGTISLSTGIAGTNSLMSLLLVVVSFEVENTLMHPSPRNPC